MADLREQILVDNMGARLFLLPSFGAFANDVKLALRRFVIRTSNTPLRALYLLAYRAHVRYGVRVMKRLPGVRAVYVTRGVASGEIVPGVSDVDFAIFGDWSDEEHKQVSEALRRLSASSPLYERHLWREARTVASIRPLYESDFSLMGRLHEGRTRWALKYGEDVLAALPDPPDTRLAGGFYMELRLWWSYFTQTAFGTGVLADDAVFRNSVCYKVVSESLAKIHALAGAPVESLRRKALANAIERTPTEQRAFLERLQRSGAKRHLRFDGDIHEDTFRFLLPALERVHAEIGAARAFEPIAQSAPQIDAAAAEMPRTPDLSAHVAQLVAYVKAAWSGYRAAFLAPCLSLYNPDDAALLLDVDPMRPPTVAQIRELLGLRATAVPLRQRLTVFLLLPNGAYQIEPAGPIDLWRLLMCRASNPELFELITRPDLSLDGPVRPPSPSPPVWTRFASALVDEELGVRRSAMAKVSDAPGMSALDLLRNIWRHLQLEIIAGTTRAGRPVVPLTPAAIERAVAPSGLLDADLVHELRRAYELALAGEPVDIQPLMMRLMSTFAQRASSR